MSTPPQSPLAQDTRGRPRDFGLDVKRLRRVRLIVFVVLALPILLLALLTVKFVSMPITQATHQSAYEDGDYTGAIDRLGPVRLVNWFEPYLPHLSEGTDLLQMGQDAEAEAELRTALEKWNESSDLNQPLHAQCKIINNLAISIERQADEIGDPAERAERLYEAEVLMQPCAGGGGGDGEEGEGGGGGDGEEGEGEGGGGEEGEGEGGEGGEGGEEESEGGSGNEDSETTDDNGERIRDKRREADEEAGDDPDDRETEQGPGGEGDGGEGGSPRDPGDPRREDPEGDGPDEEAPTQGEGENQEKEDELEQRNRDSQGGDGEDDPEGSPQDPSKPW